MQLRRRGWRSARQAKPNRKTILFFSLVLFLFLTLQTFVYIEKNLRPSLMYIAKVRVKEIAAETISSALRENISAKANYSKLIEWRTDASGRTTGFMINYAEHLRIAAETKEVVQATLKSLTRFPEKVPLGQALNSAILASFGPDIPIRLTPAGAAVVHLETRHVDAGINMLLVEVFMRVEAEVTVIIPFGTDLELVETEVPISYVLVVGDVPMYYFDNKGRQIGKLNDADPAPSIPFPPAVLDSSVLLE
jgi:sporulation protein YunB